MLCVFPGADSTGVGILMWGVPIQLPLIERERKSASVTYKNMNTKNKTQKGGEFVGKQFRVHKKLFLHMEKNICLQSCQKNSMPSILR
jgi:hypothetical protein